MEQKPTALVLSTNSGFRIAVNQLLKHEGYGEVDQPKVSKPEEMLVALVDQFKKNFNPKKTSEKRDIIILNCRKNMEYRRTLEFLSKEIMKNRFKWGQEGINFNLDQVNAFVDSLLINHFVLGADFVYQIEDNQKVQISFGDINTDEFLSCANLFGELGVSFATYFEKDLEPTVNDVKQYNGAMQTGKLAVMNKMKEGNLSGEDVAKILDEKVKNCTLSHKSEKMKKRFLKDIQISLEDKEKKKEVSKKRVDIVESADVFKQYLALKDEALAYKENKNYQEMERSLKKAIDLLEGTGDSGQKSLFDTYIELGKSQLQQKKFVSSQRNAANAKKIRKEAPSPQRLMGECQMGQATDALEKGDYEEASKYFDKANDYMQESQKMAKEVEVEEQDENEREIATTIAYFKEEAQKVFEKDPKAKEVLQGSIAYNLLTKTASDLKKKHNIVEEGELSHDISLTEVSNKLREANKLLKTPADPGACNELLKKLFEANTEKTLEQLLKLDGLLAKILENAKDESRYERALIYIRFAMGYESTQKELVEQKFQEINFNIARDQLGKGVDLLKEFYADSAHPDSARKKSKAHIHMQKAFHQNEDIVGEVVEMAVEHARAIQGEIGNTEALHFVNMALKIEFSDEEQKFLQDLKNLRKEIKQFLDKTGERAMEAAGLVLEKKLTQAREVYEKAVKMDEMTAFRAVSDLAKDLKGKGEIRKAYDLYSWIARVDRNETDLQYINAAWCCLLLGDKDRAKKHVEAALLANKNVIEEAREMDPEFEQSEINQFFVEEWEKKEKEKAKAKAAPPVKAAAPTLSNENLNLIKKAANILATKDLKGAYVILKNLHQRDPRAFDKLIAMKPGVKKMPVYAFYLKNILKTGSAPQKTPAAKPFSKEDMVFVMEANKLFMEGKTRDAVMKLIQALKKDKMILVKACGVSSKFKESMLMKFYFQNKVKLPKFLGFTPQP